MTKRGIYHIIVIETFTKGKLHQTLNLERQRQRESIPQRLVMAFEMASAVQTPFPDPDMSSPSNNFENLSFIISISV
jgi:hypothetical protein